MMALLPVIASNGILYLQMRSVGSHNRSGRDKEGKDAIGVMDFVNFGTINTVFSRLI